MPPPRAPLPTAAGGAPGRRRDRSSTAALLLDRWAPWLLVLAVFATRLPFQTQTLYAFDSGNYALAVRDFYNVAFHQPQPPGYPLYVAIAWVINLLVRDANRALVLESVLLSAVAVWSTVGIARALFGRSVGLLAGLLLVGTVGFWGYGEVAYPYVGLAAETATIAYLAHRVIGGRGRFALPLGLAMGISAGIRWDGAVFGALLYLWALWAASWRWRIISLAAAAAVVVGWAVPMVVLTGGPTVYLAAIQDYLKVWAPQSAYVVGELSSGQGAQANYNLTFFVNYVRQMLGVGVLLVLYLLGRRFSPSALAGDYRSRFVLLWIAPPILTYVFTHLGEAGYVLSLAPAAATMAALAILDLGAEAGLAAAMLRTRRRGRWLPRPRPTALAVSGLLAVAILGWNVQAFLRGTGPGRLPDLRTRDATTSAQVQLVRGLPPASTLVVAHDTLRQAQYYLGGYRILLQYSEYVPDWETMKTRTPIPSGTDSAVVLDSPLVLDDFTRQRARELVLRESPRVTAWVIDVRGADALESGYRTVRVVPRA